jgi:hypothetical protein
MEHDGIRAFSEVRGILGWGMDKEQPNVMFNQGGTLHPATSTLLAIIRRVD